VIRSIVAATAIGLAATAFAQAPAALGNLEYSSDSDGFHATRIRAGGLRPYASYFDHAGVAVQDTHYAQAGWGQDVGGIVGIWRSQAPATLAGINAEAGVVRVGGRTRAVADVTWSVRPATDTGVELIAAGDLVATRKAIERAIAFGFFGASIEQTFADRFTAIGLVGYQPFTDGNERVHWRGRLIWQAVPEQGINVQVRWRQYASRKDDVEGAYFNPDRYRQWQGVVGFRRRLGGWTYTGALGAGRETINGTDTHPVRMVELRGEGALDDKVRLAWHASYNRSTGYVDAPDYAYREVGVTLIYPF
jgi:hypothetical protein